MPDKIKDVYDLISDKGYFANENEFRTFVSDPTKRKEAYSLISDDGFFKDENEFNSFISEPVKKKEPTAPSIPSGAKNISQSPLQSNLKSEIPTYIDPTKVLKTTDLVDINAEAKPFDSNVLREQRKQRMGTHSANLMASIVKEPDLYTKKASTSHWGTQAVPETPNIENISKAVDYYATKLVKKGEYLSPFDKQYLVNSLAEQVKQRKNIAEAVANTNLETANRKELPLYAYTGVKDSKGNVIKKGIFEETNEKIIKEQTKEVNNYKINSDNLSNKVAAEVAPEVTALKLDVKGKAEMLNQEVSVAFNKSFEEKDKAIYEQYNQLVQSGQMSAEVANNALKIKREELQKQTQEEVSAAFAPKFDALNKESNLKSKDIQSTYNRNYLAKANLLKDAANKKLEEIAKKNMVDMPEGYIERWGKDFQKNLALIDRKNANKSYLEAKNMSVESRMAKAVTAGFGDVLGSIGGAMSFAGIDASAVNDVVIKTAMQNELASGAYYQYKDEESKAKGDKYENFGEKLLDPSWWIDNGVRSVPFMLATMPVGIAAGYGTGYVAKLLGASKRASAIASAVGGGAVSWYGEATLEAGSAFNDALKQGYSEKDAGEIAAKTFKNNLWTLPLSVFQMMPVFSKAFNFSKAFAVETLSGGAEEILQGWSQAQANAAANGQDISLFEYAKTPQALEEGVIGASMSAGMAMFALDETPNIDKQISALMSSISVGGEQYARAVLDVMNKNKAITDAQYKEANLQIDYILNGIESVQNFNVDDNLKVGLVSKFAKIGRAKALITDDENDLASQAAKEMIAEQEKEIKEILKGNTPLYLVFQKGNPIPTTTTKEQFTTILKDPKLRQEFTLQAINDDAWQAQVDKVYKTEKPIEEVVNAEQEVIPATEAPAAPISGVSGEVQASGDVENKRDVSQFANENESYRVIVGDEAFNDIVESGVVRTNAGNKNTNKEDSVIDLTGRPTAFPSFSKGSASMSYAGKNPNNYIIVTEDPSIQPSKSGRHGKGKTMFPTDENGNHLKELSGDKVKVYKHIGNGQYELVYDKGKVVEKSLPNIEQTTTNEQQNDKENGTGVQSNIGEGKEPIKTKPNETTGGEKIEAGGNVQASEEEVVAKLQKSIDKINEQRDSELRTATGKVIYTDNPTEAEKSQRVKDKVQEINDRYNAIIEREKEKQAKETTKPIAEQEVTKKTTEVTPKEGDTSITKSARGTIQNMVFKDGEWQIKFGKVFTTVSNAVQKEAQDYFNEKNVPVAEVKEQAPVVKEQAAPPVKAEEKPVKEQKEPVKEQTEKEKAKEKAKEELRARAAKAKAEAISAAQKVQQALEATGITVEVLDNEKEFQDKLDAEGVNRASSAGKSGVFISKSGKIFINGSKVDANWGSVDVWHEGTHPIINIIRNTNPKLYNSIVDGLNKLVTSNPEIADVLKWAQKNYKGKNTLEDETITETIARIANGNIDISKIPTSLRDKIIDFINEIAKSLGIKPMFKSSNVATFKKIAGEISAALKEGKDISSIVGAENVQKYEGLTIAANGGVFTVGNNKKSNRKPDKKVKLNRPFDDSLIQFTDIDNYNGKKAVAFFGDMQITADVESPTGVKFSGRGGALYPIWSNQVGLKKLLDKDIKVIKDGSIWATTDLNGANKLLNALKRGSLAALATQKPSGVLGNKMMLEHYANLLNKSIDSYQKIIDSKSATSTEKTEAENKIKELIEAINSPLDSSFKKGVSFRDKITDVLNAIQVSKKTTDIQKENAKKSLEVLKIGKFDTVEELYDAMYDLSYEVRTGFFVKVFNLTNSNKFNLPSIERGKSYKYDKTILEYTNDPLFKNSDYGDIVGFVEYDPKTLRVERTTVEDEFHHKSYHYAIKGDILGVKYFNNPIDGRAIFYESKPKTEGEGINQTQFGLREKAQASKGIMGSMPSNTVSADDIKRRQADYEKGVIPQFSQGNRDAIANENLINGFYSNTENALGQVKQEKMSGNQWVTQLLSRGANKEEMVLTGLESYLKENAAKPVSKADIQKYLKDNRIEIEEVVKGVSKMSKSEAKKVFEDKGYDVITDRNGDTYVEKDEEAFDYNDMSEAEQNAFDVLTSNNLDRVNTSNDTKFGNRPDLQLEGEKENYKEVLVTLPQKDVYSIEETENKGNYVLKVNGGNYAFNDNVEYLKNIQTKLESGELKHLGKKFQSSHFGEANILVHLRMNTRIDSNGNKVLFIEEVQSDWGQTGKKKGFKPTFEIRNEKGMFNVYSSINNMKEPAFTFDTKEDANKMLETLSKTNESKVSTAPFVMDTNAWTKLGLKVALKEAVAQGVDKIAWTTGEQQNDRYDLSKSVNEIKYKKNSDGNYRIEIEFKNGDGQNGNVEEKELEATVGKEIAQKIIDTAKSDFQAIKEDGLKVGGKGMKGFYGSPTEGKLGIVGEVAKSLVKQEPKTISINGIESFNEPIVTELAKKYDTSFPTLSKAVRLNETEKLKELGVSKQDIETIKNSNQTTQYSIDITPELKAQVEEGLPQFSQGNRDIQSIADMITETQQKGVLDDNEIAETLEESYSKEEIQEAFDYINNPPVIEPAAKETVEPSKVESEKVVNSLNTAEVEAVAKALAKEEKKGFDKTNNTERNNARNKEAEKELKDIENAANILAITQNINEIRAKLLENGNIKTIDCKWG